MSKSPRYFTLLQRLNRLCAKEKYWERFHYTSSSSSVAHRCKVRVLRGRKKRRPSPASLLIFQRVQNPASDLKLPYGTFQGEDDSAGCEVCGFFLDLWVQDLERGVPSLVADSDKRGPDLAAVGQQGMLEQIAACNEDEVKSWEIQPLSEDEDNEV